jgi:hypothetical protein
VLAAWAPSGSMPVLIYRVHLDTGERTKIGENAPADRAGVMSFELYAYRDNGAQYIYGYSKRMSALYLIDRK